MGGIGARRSFLTASKPPGPPISLRTSATGGGVGTSLATAFTATLAGSLQVVSIGYSKGSTGNPTIGVSGSGWVDCGGFQGNVATINSGLRVFVRAVTAGETTFNVTCSASSTITWTVEEYLNVDTSVMPTSPAVPLTMTATTATSAQSVSSNTITTGADGDLVLSFLGGRGPAAAAIAITWGGGAIASNTANPGRAAFAYTAYQVVSGAAQSITHTMGYTNSQGSANTVRGSLCFKKIP